MDTIGKYHLEEKIGSGGFGDVFRGYDPLIKRHVAIKVCGTGDEEIAQRFTREAEIGGNLHHRNVTTVYDFGVHDGLPYLVQEYLTGEDLDVKIKRRDYLPYSEKLLYLLQVARGLAYAHAHGVIHRDIKPANVRILEDGTAKILDFGIAKLAQHETGLTQTGMTLGTAAYLAPEQVRGEAVDLRTDVFSFGVLAYELITYARPFQGEQISTLLYNLLHREPESLTTHWPGAPPALVELIDRCLRKDAEQRYADGNELVAALEQLKQSSGARQAGATTGRVQSSRPGRQSGATSSHVPMAPMESPSRDQPTAALRDADAFDSGPPLDPPANEAVAVDPQNVRAGRRSNVGSIVLLLVLAAVAAAGGWWLGTRGETEPPDAPQATSTDQPTSDETPTTEPSVPTPEASQSSDAAVEEPSEMEPQVAVTEPPPPPPPVTGRLILARVPWTDQMTVRVGDDRYRLHQQHEVELTPGSYRAVFELDADGYRPSNRTVEVRIEAGQSSAIETPIPSPAAFSVRPLPGRAQGRAMLDGEPLGSTPLSGIRREPGVYLLEILPRGSDEGGLSEQISLESGRESILSFDLEAGTVAKRSKALIP